MKPRDAATYLYLALAWGLSFLVLLRVVRAFGWAGAVSLRSLLAGTVLLLAARLAGRRLDFSAGWRPFAAMGATTVAAQLAGLSLATPRIGTAMMAIMAATIPLFSMLLSQWWGLERITPQRLVGLLLGALGIVLLVGFPQVPYTLDFALGMVAALVTAISAAWGSNYARRRLQGVDAWSLTTASFLWGGLFTLPLLLQQPVPGTPDAGDWLHLLTLAVVMSALAYVLYFRLVSAIGPTRAASVEFAVTGVAVGVGALLLREPLGAAQWLGGGVILLGCMLVLDLLPRRARLH